METELDSSMHILVVTQYFWPENFRINDLVEELILRGHQVAVLTGVPNYPSGKLDGGYKANPEKYSTYKGADIFRVPILLRGNHKLMLALNYISFAIIASIVGVFKLRNKKFDVIFVFEPSPVTVGVPAILLRWLKKAPLVFWVLDLWPDTLKALGVRSKVILKAVGLLVSFVYQNCDLILGQAKSFVNSIQGRSINKQVKYFPSWAEPIFNSALLVDGGKVSQDYFNVMFAGNIGEAQDFPAIVDAAEILNNEDYIHWTIVGNGRMYAWLKDEIYRRGLEDKFTLAGRHDVEMMPTFFNSADLLLVTLKDEPVFSMTIPGKLQAYLQTGKPIVTMLNGEGAQIVAESGCGITCRAGDSAGLAKAVRRLSKMSESERNIMGQCGIDYSKREFDRIMLINRLENWMGQLSENGIGSVVK